MYALVVFNHVSNITLKKLFNYSDLSQSKLSDGIPNGKEKWNECCGVTLEIRNEKMLRCEMKKKKCKKKNRLHRKKTSQGESETHNRGREHVSRI